MVSDIELASRIRAGDRAALAELYDRYLPAVWRYAMARLRPDDAAARDAVSETFLAAIRQIARFDAAKGSVAAWLLAIARHKITDALRSRGRLAEMPGAASLDADPAAPLVERETRGAVTQTLLAMEDEQRLVLEWKYLDGLSVREIAERLGRSEKAGEAVLFRARAEFRRAFRLIADTTGGLT